jgi:hypothetical protein
MTGNSQLIALKTRTGDLSLLAGNLLGAVLELLCVQRQAAAVRMFLRFFRLSMLPFQIGV